MPLQSTVNGESVIRNQASRISNPWCNFEESAHQSLAKAPQVLTYSSAGSERQREYDVCFHFEGTKLISS